IADSRDGLTAHSSLVSMGSLAKQASLLPAYGADDGSWQHAVAAPDFPRGRYGGSSVDQAPPHGDSLFARDGAGLRDYLASTGLSARPNLSLRISLPVRAESAIRKVAPVRPSSSAVGIPLRCQGKAVS